MNCLFIFILRGGKMDNILTIPEVAKYLKMSKSKIYALVQTGRIPYIRIGKNVRVKEGELQKWLENNSQISSLFEISIK